MLVHERLLNGYGVWVDAEPTRQVVKAFKTLGENIAESLSKGDRVFVHGTITTEVWTDKDNGDKRTAQRVWPTSSARACAGHHPYHQDHPH